MSWEAIAALSAAFALPTIGFIFTLGKVWNKFEESERARKMLWNTVETLQRDANGIGAKIRTAEIELGIKIARADQRRRKLAVAILSDDKKRIIANAEE